MVALAEKGKCSTNTVMILLVIELRCTITRPHTALNQQSPTSTTVIDSSFHDPGATRPFSAKKATLHEHAPFLVSVKPACSLER